MNVSMERIENMHILYVKSKIYINIYMHAFECTTRSCNDNQHEYNSRFFSQKLLKNLKKLIVTEKREAFFERFSRITMCMESNTNLASSKLLL